MKALVIAGLIIGFAAPVQAACISLPDGPQSAYVLNGQAQVLCLQGELASDTARRNLQTQIDATLQRQQLQQLQQQFEFKQWQAQQLLP